MSNQAEERKAVVREWKLVEKLTAERDAALLREGEMRRDRDEYMFVAKMLGNEARTAESEVERLKLALERIIAICKEQGNRTGNGKWADVEELAEAASPAKAAPPHEEINFACGCFLRFWADGGVLRSGLACCKAHEAPHQTLANLLKHRQIEFTRKDGMVEVGRCSNCKTAIKREWNSDTRYWGDWSHNDPHKPNYLSYLCVEKGRTEHCSTPSRAMPVEGSTRYAD